MVVKKAPWLWRTLLGVILLTAGCTAEPPVDSDAWVEKHSCQSRWARKNAPRWTWSEYKAILDELAKPMYVVVPLAEFRQAVSETTDRVVVGLRHDLDGNICAARTMAEIENRRGIRATYFLNHNDRYYSWVDETGVRRRREATVYRYRELHELGHEIGLHYDTITNALLEGADPRAVLSDEIAWLRSHGIVVRGGAAHGAALSYTVPYSNYEIFAGMTTRTNQKLSYLENEVTLGALRVEEFFDYEAYFIGHTRYYSEAGGKWGELSPLNPENGLATLAPGESAQILIHPVWWTKNE